VLALVVAIPLVAGCSELKKYWSRSPTGPQILKDTTAPTVTLHSPSGPDTTRATPVTGSAFAVVIDARDDVGVVRVELQIDSLPTIQVPGPPWQIPWNTTELAEGSSHSLWATATDAAGNVGVSDTVYARSYNAGPVIVLTEPANGSLVKGLIPVTAQFVGTAHPIEQLEFLADAASVGVLTGPPWTVSLDTGTLTPGDHFIAARATTLQGHVGVSAAVRIRVNNLAPVVAIDFPPTGHRLATRGTLIVSGSAVDGVEGAIPLDRFSWRSSLDGVIGAGPYFRRRGLSVGMHTLTAEAVNAWGTTATASIQVEVMALPTYTFCNNIKLELLTQRSCISCHRPSSPYFVQDSLDVQTYDNLMAGGLTSRPTALPRSYECVSPCRPESSLIWNKLNADVPWVGEPMPPRDRFPAVPAAILEKLRIWILEGAPPDEPGQPCP